MKTIAGHSEKAAGKIIGALTISILLTLTLWAIVRQPSSVAAGETVEVWLTLADESKKLHQETNQTFVAGSGSATYTINVDESTLYQQFEGVGAAMTDSSAWLIPTIGSSNNVSKTFMANNLVMSILVTRNSRTQHANMTKADDGSLHLPVQNRDVEV